MQSGKRIQAECGFTIIELMVVITIIVIIALIAVPNLISARLSANETAAIQTLRSVSTAQQQFLKSAKADEDGDGAGEYGGLGELSGVVGARGGSIKVPTDLSRTMGRVTPAGEVEKSSYIFRAYLPDVNGHGVRENGGGGYSPGVLTPNLSEGFFTCYAWPSRYGISGIRTFVVNQQGDIHFADVRDYTGENCVALLPGAAYRGASVDSITGSLASGTAGADGNIWKAAR